MSGDVLVIRMQTPGSGMGEPCVNCGKPSSGFHGLPVFNGDIVSNDWPGEWGGACCCEDCYNRHAAGQLETADYLYRVYLDRLGTFVEGAGI